MSENTGGSIDNVMQESRLFPPSEEFLKGCEINSLEAYQDLYDRAAADPVKFWGELAREELHWFQDFDQTLDRGSENLTIAKKDRDRVLESLVEQYKAGALLQTPR